METDFQPFVFHSHVAAVGDLWQRVFGLDYPIHERVLAMRLGLRPAWEPGDEIILMDGPRAIAFGQVDIDRTATGPPPIGRLNLIMVDPAWRRRGIGRRLLSALEDRMTAAGCSSFEAGGFLNRFWSGIPEELTPACRLLETQGYRLDQAVHDCIVDLDRDPTPPLDATALSATGLCLAPAGTDDLAALLEFETAEFPAWVPSLIRMLDAGDLHNVLLLKNDVQIVGTIQTFTPASRWRGPNLVWDAIFGPGLGGYGAVGVAAACRGRGLGSLLCRGAQRHLREHHATHALIDWTALLDFYARFGARPWKRFRRGQRVR